MRSIIWVYLAGAVTGQTLTTSGGWRDALGRRLVRMSENRDIRLRAVNPLRDKPLAPEKAILPDYEDTPEHGDDFRLATKCFVERDLLDIRKCDCVLANFTTDPDGLSKGTLIEMGYAFALQKPIIVVAPEDAPIREAPFVKHVSFVIVPTLDEGVQAIEYLCP